MADYFINWRFGYIQLKIGKWYITIKPNYYYKDNKQEKFFERY